MKQRIPQLVFLSFFVFISTGVTVPDNIEKVDIYLGHFLLQTWPQAHRTINIEVDPAFPPDTLVFRASGPSLGIKRAVLQIKDLSGVNTLQQLSCGSIGDDQTCASYIYVLNQNNLNQIKDKGFKVVLERHHDNGTEVRNMATIMLDKKEPAVTDADPSLIH